MKRLTCCNYDVDSYVCNVDEDICQDILDCGGCHVFDDIVVKLGRYEDTGLEPEDVQKVADFMKLFPKLCEKYILNGKEEIG